MTEQASPSNETDEALKLSSVYWSDGCPVCGNTFFQRQHRTFDGMLVYCTLCGHRVYVTDGGP